VMASPTHSLRVLMVEDAATGAELNARELLSAFTTKEPGKGTGLGLDT